MSFPSKTSFKTSVPSQPRPRHVHGPTDFTNSTAGLVTVQKVRYRTANHEISPTRSRYWSWQMVKYPQQTDKKSMHDVLNLRALKYHMLCIIWKKYQFSTTIPDHILSQSLIRIASWHNPGLSEVMASTMSHPHLSFSTRLGDLWN